MTRLNDRRRAKAGALVCACFLLTAMLPVQGFAVEPEEEQARLQEYLWQDMDYARLGPVVGGGLTACNPERNDGAVESIYVCFNGGNASAHFDTPAFLDLQVNRVRVPIRFLTSLIRAEVAWDAESATVTIQIPAVSREVVHPVSLPGYKPEDWWLTGESTLDPSTFQLALQTVTRPAQTVVLKVGQPLAVVDGRTVALDAPPVIVPPGRVMVPVRFIAELAGAKVYWIGREPIWQRLDGTPGGRYQVHIYTPVWPFYEYPSWFLENRASKF